MEYLILKVLIFISTNYTSDAISSRKHAYIILTHLNSTFI